MDEQSAPPIGLDKTSLMLEIAAITDADTAYRVTKLIWASHWLRERDGWMRLQGATMCDLDTTPAQPDASEDR